MRVSVGIKIVLAALLPNSTLAEPQEYKDFSYYYPECKRANHLLWSYSDKRKFDAFLDRRIGLYSDLVWGDRGTYWEILDCGGFAVFHVRQLINDFENFREFSIVIPKHGLESGSYEPNIIVIF